MFQRNQALTLQINKQNSNLHQTGLQLQQAQVDLNAALGRCQEVEALCVESQKFYAGLENELQEEKQNHKNTCDALETEMKELATAEKNLERYWSTLKGLSEFLTMVQVTSSEDKAVVTTSLLSEGGNDIGSLLMEIENKKEYIQILEEEHRLYKQALDEGGYCQFDDVEKTKDWPIAELEDNKNAADHDQADQEMTEAKQESLFKKKMRSDRKASRRNGH